MFKHFSFVLLVFSVLSTLSHCYPDVYYQEVQDLRNLRRYAPDFSTYSPAGRAMNMRRSPEIQLQRRGTKSRTPSPERESKDKKTAAGAKLEFQTSRAKKYTPRASVQKSVEYMNLPKDKVTEFFPPWDKKEKMRMYGSFYKIYEKPGSKEWYGSTVEAFLQTHKPVDAGQDKHGKGMWIKITPVSAYQVGAEDAGKVVHTMHNGKLEQAHTLKEGDYVYRQDGSSQQEIQATDKANFDSRYMPI